MDGSSSNILLLSTTQYPSSTAFLRQQHHRYRRLHPTTLLLSFSLKPPPPPPQPPLEPKKPSNLHRPSKSLKSSSSSLSPTPKTPSNPLKILSDPSYITSPSTPLFESEASSFTTSTDSSSLSSKLRLSSKLSPRPPPPPEIYVQHDSSEKPWCPEPETGCPEPEFRQEGKNFVICGRDTATKSAMKAVEFDGVEFHGRVLTVKLEDGNRMKTKAEERAKWVEGEQEEHYVSTRHQDREGSARAFRKGLETKPDNWI